MFVFAAIVVIPTRGAFGFFAGAAFLLFQGAPVNLAQRLIGTGICGVAGMHIALPLIYALACFFFGFWFLRRRRRFGSCLF